MAPAITTRQGREPRAKRQGTQPGDVIIGDSRDRFWLSSPNDHYLLDLAQQIGKAENVTPQVVLWRFIVAGAIAYGYDVPDSMFINGRRPQLDSLPAHGEPAGPLQMPTGHTPAQTMRTLSEVAYNIEETVGDVLTGVQDRKAWGAMASVATCGQKAHELGEALESAEAALRG